MTLLPARKDRDMHRGRLAAAGAKAAGLSAMEVAQAQIDATFGVSAIHNRRKQAAARAIDLGAEHRSNRGEYRAIAIELPPQLDGAISSLKLGILIQQNKDARLARDGHRPQISNIERMRVALIVCRWMRRKGMAGQFPAILDAASTHFMQPISARTLEAAE